jgi:predicted acetyltransferase
MSVVLVLFLWKFDTRRYRHTVTDDNFEFFHDPLDSDQELTLLLTECTSAGESIWGVPAYTFAMRHAQTGQTMGRIRLRVGWNEESIRFAGQIGYLVEPAFRGHRYAERAGRLIAPLARRHGLLEIWITCQPENLASRRTLERLGAQFVEVVPVPDTYPLDAGANRQKACYRWQPNPSGLASR